VEQPVVEVREVKKIFPPGGMVFFRKRGREVRAVDGVSFSIRSGETFGLVGESGCGKSTVGRLLLRLQQTDSGEIRILGHDVVRLSREEISSFRREVQAVFQDPYGSLNPRMTVAMTIGEPLWVQKLASQKELEERVVWLLEKVGLSPEHRNRYPHEFSGGQRQRIVIARALSVSPRFVILDEPVSALDVSIRAQILNLLKDLQKELGLTFLFISHDLSVIEHISHEVGVMYLGRMMEIANREELYRNPKHPYTQALLEAIPIPDPDRKKEGRPLEGEAPSPLSPPSGCRFHTRCPCKMEICKEAEPELKNLGEDHRAACHLY
jgi:oligopeptide/dipeptide ABC transporter ATP-binding protein